MTIYLIRHAQSMANAGFKTQSHADIDLSEIGQTQAKQLGEILPKAHSIFISKYIRTFKTAEPLLQRDKLVPILKNIHEFSYLPEDSCRNTTVLDRKPFVDSYWAALDCDLVVGPGAESFQQFYHRVNIFLKELQHLKKEFSEKNLMVFSHGQFLQLCRMLLEHHRPCDSNLMKEFRDLTIHQPIQNIEFFRLLDHESKKSL